MRLGVDLLSVSRFTPVAEHRRYRTLVFTATELAQAGELGTPRYAERLAGRFCVKEATCKLLGRGFGQGLRWRDIEVTNDPWGAPAVTLSGGAGRLAGEAGVEEIAVTLTHQADLVVAVAASPSGRCPSPYRPGRPEDGADQVIDPARDALEEVAALAAEVFGTSAAEVRAAESFAGGLGVSSSLTVELLARLEQRYGIRVPEPDFYRMTDLGRTYQVVARAARW
ncbi:holo-ACP synthase [Streptomyces sp. SL13]|uniref:Holo-[acyl-carrier-protein] synthase n=1 Tax=Streptantibioticus silvisoli TaxID=2705255 RepID=A0AA90HA89_9ACTN|nr:holo-ACP synthase [Streptantibioticus silvisoli]MDI5970927.1 holo-ACP synthase [Streptantibioticus silvisoli]